MEGGVKRKAESTALVEMAPPKQPLNNQQLVGIDSETRKQLMTAVSNLLLTLHWLGEYIYLFK